MRKSGPSASTRTLYNLVLKRQARKVIGRLPDNARERVTRAIDGLVEEPFPPGRRKLQGRESWRIRVGDYRIVYAVDDERSEVTVLQVGHRRDVYRQG